ncbi:MAG: sensor histidine kinase [Rhodospirillaceae bacterium]|nr:sensor histidine kinase [Rhodospirillaceae bacterium]MBT6118872.1 sensor histidine kinase [Rhodospirillaceae bacterium]
MALHHVLFFGFTLMAAVPVALLGAWVQQSALEKEIASVRDMHRQVADNIVLALSNYVHDADAAFRMSIAALQRGSWQPEVVSLLDAMHFKHVCLIGADGTIIEWLPVHSDQASSALSPATMSALAPLIPEAQASMGTVRFSNVMPDSAGDPTIHMLIANPDGTISLAALSTAFFVELQQSVAFGKGGHAAIVDRTGHVIAHPNGQWRDEIKDISKVAPVQAMMRGESGVSIFYSPAAKKDMIAGFTVVPAVGWGAMVPQPMENLIGRASDVQFAAAGIILLGIVVVAFISWWLAGYLSGPIRAVVEASHANARGRFDVKAPRPRGPAPRELAELVNAFNGMVDEVGRKNTDLADARDRAEAASKAKSDFLANISHELRTPLNAIIGFSELIRSEAFGPVGNDRYREYAADVHDSAQHLRTMINDVLDLSKAEAGHIDVRIEPIEVGSVVEASTRMMQALADEKNVALETDLPAALPAVRTDEGRLRQVLLNILSNAVKFTPAGGRVRVSVEAGEGMVIAIEDTGIGVAARDMPKVMAPFGRGETSWSRQYEGTGLGLPLSKRIMEALGGVLELDSEIGVGTRVRLRLPLDSGRRMETGDALPEVAAE